MKNFLSNPQKGCSAWFRKRRMNFFFSQFSIRDKTILDVGGRPQFWDRYKLSVTIVNLEEYADKRCVVGNALDLPFTDNKFDIAFSNSVIEHVGDFQNQTKFAKEIMRVGKTYFVQTPSKYFPLEPHFLIPYFQFFPRSCKIWLVRHFTLGWIKRRRDRSKAAAIVDSIQLLSKKQLRILFPKAYIKTEWFLCFPKSYLVYKK
ncbi:MAG: SAM-dependent methyltransferase [Candidatus Woesearchaeota archaeon]|jgi:SAM-dependent methyltransferase